MGRLLIIDVVAAVAALGAWYLLFAAYNRRRGCEDASLGTVRVRRQRTGH